MRNTWLQCVEKEIESGHEDIVVITADLGFGVYEKFEVKYPKNFINCGVSEQNMVGVAAGLALTGKKVFCYSIANFPTLRCIEQIRNDVCYHDLDVHIVSVGGGFGYGALGMSHHATEDLSIMRCIPNLSTYVPYNSESTEAITQHILSKKVPTYMRLERGSTSISNENLSCEYNGFSSYGPDDASVRIFSIGGISEEAIELVEKLYRVGQMAKLNIVTSLHDYNVNYLRDELTKASKVISIEENVTSGGLGSWLLEICAEFRINVGVVRFGITGFVSTVGDQLFLRKHCGIDAESIYKKIQGQLS